MSQEFDPTSVRPNVVNWVRYDDTDPSLESRKMSAFNKHLDQHFVNSASDGEVLAAANHLSFRDPKHFVAGGLHCYPQVCSQLFASVPTFPQAAEVLKWIHQKVDVFDFFVPFKGPYKGEQFNSVLPPPKIFVNRLWCKPFTGFISQTILDRLCSGAISLLGKVGEVDPPYLVMPLTVEPSNLFINPYVFSPICLISQVFEFLKSLHVPFTMVVPDVNPRKFWWPILCAASKFRVLLASAGSSGVLLGPSKDGYSNEWPLPWDLWVFRISPVSTRLN